MRKLLHISYLEHKTNDWVQSMINFLMGPQEPLLATVKRRQLPWVGVPYTIKASSNHPLGHFGGWMMPWLAEKMLDGQHQREDIPAHARPAHKDLLQKRQEEISAESSPMSPL